MEQAEDQVKKAADTTAAAGVARAARPPRAGLDPAETRPDLVDDLDGGDASVEVDDLGDLL